MRTLFSFFLLSLLLSLISAQSNSTDRIAEIENLIDQVKTQIQTIEDFFESNRGNLTAALVALNQNNLKKAKIMLKQLIEQARQIRLEEDKIRNDNEEQKNRSKIIKEYLNRKPHLLFDDSTSDPSSDTTSNDDQDEIVLAQYCTRAFVDSIPPSYCTKTPIELGTDVVCAPGDEDFPILRRCYQPCADGYYAVGAICFQTCPSGYSPTALKTCYKSLFNFFAQDWYLRSYYSKSDSRATCPVPKAKQSELGLTLCFKDCSRIDLINCGAHTCGMSNDACATGLKSILQDLILGIGKLFLNIITFGISGLITAFLANSNAMYNAAKAAGHDSMQAVWQNVKAWMGRINQDKLLNEMVALTQTYVNQNATLAANLNADRIKNRCASVRDIFYQKLVTTTEVVEEWKDFSSKNLREYVNVCQQANNGDACKRAIRDSVLWWEPSGIITMIAAFKQDSCPSIN